MQRSISISASIPPISIRPASPPRVAPGVRLKVARIVWAAALIALGLGPTSVMAEDKPTVLRRSPTNGLWTGAGTEVHAHSKATRDLVALHGEYQTYLEQPQAKARGASGFRSANVLARIAAGHVVVDLVSSGDPEALAADLEAWGSRTRRCSDAWSRAVCRS
ncbi:MAG: hypothetical protein M3461_10335 [Pseudomonadota bacterium]|nr:hypothetical protein [Pseudomonadota bacterium]